MAAARPAPRAINIREPLLPWPRCASSWPRQFGQAIWLLTWKYVPVIGALQKLQLSALAWENSAFSNCRESSADEGGMGGVEGGSLFMPGATLKELDEKASL